MYILNGDINSFTYQEPTSSFGAKIVVCLFSGIFMIAGVCIVVMSIKGE